jgi:hypothetical protein
MIIVFKYESILTRMRRKALNTARNEIFLTVVDEFWVLHPRTSSPSLDLYRVRNYIAIDEICSLVLLGLASYQSLLSSLEPMIC